MGGVWQHHSVPVPVDSFLARRTDPTVGTRFLIVQTRLNAPGTLLTSDTVHYGYIRVGSGRTPVFSTLGQGSELGNGSLRV